MDSTYISHGGPALRSIDTSTVIGWTPNDPSIDPQWTLDRPISPNGPLLMLKNDSPHSHPWQWLSWWHFEVHRQFDRHRLDPKRLNRCQSNWVHGPWNWPQSNQSCRVGPAFWSQLPWSHKRPQPRRPRCRGPLRPPQHTGFHGC